MVKATVKSVIIDSSGKAHGVMVQKGPAEVAVHAPMVISAAGAWNTFKRLVPFEHQWRVAKIQKKLQISGSLRPSVCKLSRESLF